MGWSFQISYSLRENLVRPVSKDLEGRKETLASRATSVCPVDQDLTVLKVRLELRPILPPSVKKEWPVKMASRAGLEDLVFPVTLECAAGRACPVYMDSNEKLATKVCLVSTPSSGLLEILAKEALLVCLALLARMAKMDFLVLPVLRDRQVTTALVVSLEFQA